MSRLLILAPLAAALIAAPAAGAPAPARFGDADYARRSWDDTAVLCAPDQRKATRASSIGCYSGYSAPRYDAFERRSFYVPVRDGTRLAVDVYRPLANGKPAEGRLPVVFNYSRYWRATELPDGSTETYVGAMKPGQTQSLIDEALARGRGGEDRQGVGLLLQHGYIFVRAEARGAGASFGVRNGDLSGREAQDGRDIIDWINRQPWASGKVAMIGGSYEGMSQHLVASAAPKGLVAIFPMVATFDEYRASWSGSGILRKYGLAWLAREARRDGVQSGISGSTINPADTSRTMVARVDADVDGRQREAARQERRSDPDAVNPMSYFTRQSPAAGELVRLIGHALGTHEPAPIIEVLYSTPALNALMEKAPGLREKLTALRFARDDAPMTLQAQNIGANNLAMLAPRISASGVAVYNWGGWRDFATLDTLLWDANHRGPKKLTMGPWTHGPNEPDDLREVAAAELRRIEQLRWVDYWLKGVPNGVLQEPAVNYAVLTERDGFYWRTAPAWPPQGFTPRRWALGPAQVLGGAGAADRTASFTADYNSSLGEHTRYHDAIGLGPTALPDLDAHARTGLSWTSQAVGAGFEMTGSPIVNLQLTSSTPDADIHATLEKIDPAGVVTYLSDGELRASHRKQGPAPYRNLGLPFSDSRRAALAATPPLDAKHPQHLVFDLSPTSTRLRSGDRLRLVLTAANAHTTLTIPQAPATQFTVHLSRSWLSLPVRSSMR